MNNLAEKIKALPKNIKGYLTSLVSTNTNVEITSSFNVPSDRIVKIINLQSKFFVKEIPIADFPKMLKEASGLDEQKSKELALQFAGRKFLMVDDYFNGEASKLVISLGGKPDDFKADLEKQKADLKKEQAEIATEEKESKNKTEETSVDNSYVKKEAPKDVTPVSPEEEKHSIMNLFEEELLSILEIKKDDDIDLIQDLDREILEFLLNDEKFKASLETAISNNKQPLSSNQLIIDSQKAEPIAANWLRDLMKNNKGNDFNLALTDYLTQSDNFRKLNAGEKAIINNLFKLHHNLHYWPDSVATLPLEKWQIIPYNSSNEELSKTVNRSENVNITNNLKPEKEEKENQVNEPVVTPPRPAAAPTFHFNPKDEDEVAKIKEELVSTPSVDWPAWASEISKKSGLKLKDEVLNRRFINIIIARLKDVRDALETKDVMTRPTKVGGLGMEAVEADRLIKLIGEEIKVGSGSFGSKIKEEKTEQPIKSKGPILPAKREELKEALKASAEVTKQKLSSSVKFDLAHELAPPPPSLVKSEPVKPKAKLPMPEKKNLPPLRRPTRLPVGPKPRIDDVKPIAKLVGPVGELGNMNVVDFRRISPEANRAASKIMEMVDLLENDSFAERLAGIKAWRDSDLYRLYLSIGRESMLKGKLVKEVIEEKKKRGEPTLTEAEFEAIMDLNNKLRF